VHITGPHIQIQRRIPLDPPDPGPTKPDTLHRNPPARDQGQAKTVYVSFVITDRNSCRMKTRRASGGGTSQTSHSQPGGVMR